MLRSLTTFMPQPPLKSMKSPSAKSNMEDRGKETINVDVVASINLQAKLSSLKVTLELTHM